MARSTNSHDKAGSSHGKNKAGESKRSEALARMELLIAELLHQKGKSEKSVAELLAPTNCTATIKSEPPRKRINGNPPRRYDEKLSRSRPSFIAPLSCVVKTNTFDKRPLFKRPYERSPTFGSSNCRPFKRFSTSEFAD